MQIEKVESSQTLLNASILPVLLHRASLSHMDALEMGIGPSPLLFSSIVVVKETSAQS